MDLWRGKLSPRKVDVLIRGLPPDSATRIALNEGAPHWTPTDYVLADLFDAVQGHAWITAAVNSKKKPKQPEPYPRPGAKAKQKKTITAADLLAFRERTRKE